MSRSTQVTVQMAARLLVAVTSAALVLTTVATAAVANPPSTTATRDPNPIGGGDNSGNGGGSLNDGDCHLYANPGHFGVSCGTVTTDPLSDIITKDQLPWCWDEVIPEQRLASYGYQPVEGSSYYIHSCLSGTVDLSRSASNQPGMEIDERIVVIPHKGGICPRPYTADQVGTCQMVLVGPQQAFVNAVSGGSIPSIVMTTQPSPTVRTNTVTGFVDVSLDAQGNRVTTQTPTIVNNGVSMYAVMTRFVIYPYGVGNNTNGANCHAYQTPTLPQPITPGTCEQCAGTASIPPGTSPENAPGDCWWDYLSSSNDQQGNKRAYPFRAEADWEVRYNDGNGDTVLAVIHKYDDLDLPVFDIQSLNYSPSTGS